MKKSILIVVLLHCAFNQLIAQETILASRIDLMLVRGDNEKVIDTCRKILAYDGMNPEIHYKMGIAYQNLLEDDLSLKCFYSATALNPDNRNYLFMLAKGYYGKGNYRQAEPLLARLGSLDSMSWVYAYYLTGSLVQLARYDDAIKIYERFRCKDTANYVYLDKLAFANLKRGDYVKATDLYNKSLSINENNPTAIKNLAYLYSLANDPDTAIKLLTKGIELDSADFDLFLRRAHLYYSRGYTKRALDDYLIVLASGDSSKLYLKRIGIGYCYNLQPWEGIPWLLKAFRADSSDFETCNYLGQSYYKIRDLKSSTYYYHRAITLLRPLKQQLGKTYVLYGDSQSSSADYKNAIESYLTAQDEWSDPNNFIKIANIFDDKLNDRENSIIYYQKYLDNLKNSRSSPSTTYVESVQKRLDFLKKNSPK